MNVVLVKKHALSGLEKKNPSYPGLILNGD